MFFPTGIVSNGLAILLGGLTGACLGRHIPKKLCETLPLMFGLSAMTIGIVNIPKVANLPALILAIILGAILGELAQLESRFEGLAGWLGGLMKMEHQDTRMQQDFVSVLVVFCFSGSGIFGALQSGLNGDHTVLLAKAVMDFFTAIIFAISLRHMVSIIALPQLVLMLLLFCSAGLLMPLISDTMLGDFMACGGVLIFATGFRIAGIRQYPIGNMLPALVLVLPLSAAWTSRVLPFLE